MLKYSTLIYKQSTYAQPYNTYTVVQYPQIHVHTYKHAHCSCLEGNECQCLFVFFCRQQVDVMCDK